MRYEDTARSNRSSVTIVAGVIFLIAALLDGSFLFGAEPAKASAAVTQVWIVNTRSAPSCGDLEAGLSRITYTRLDDSCGCGQWQDSDAAEFQASAAPGVPTTVIIHGNNTNEDWAVRHGDALYGLMKQRACGRPFRLIIWSWPSDRVMLRPRPDVQIKVCRSDVDAYYLARVLPMLPKGAPLCMEGFSLGCRTATGALQLLAGGCEAGRNLSPAVVAAWNQAGPRPIRVILLAAAMDESWLEPGCPHGLAPLAVERMLVVRNGRDRDLKWYSRLYGRGGPEAMGYAGPTGTAEGKLNVADVTCEVGRKHSFDDYQDTSPVLQQLAWYTFLCDGPAAAGEKSPPAVLAAQ